MKKEPVLVVMAAGMGSRYGGLKQIDPVGSQGEAILDYSLYDAYQAGFKVGHDDPDYPLLWQEFEKQSTNVLTILKPVRKSTASVWFTSF